MSTEPLQARLVGYNDEVSKGYKDRDYKAKKTTFDDFVKNAADYFDTLKDGGELFVERDGKFYRIELHTNGQHDIWAFYDPDRLMKTINSWKGKSVLEGVDVEKLKQDIRDARGHGAFRH